MIVPELSPEHLARLPVFPLPGGVFLPDTAMPLHIFEPRYRALARHCTLNKWPLAVSSIAAGHDASQSGPPPFETIAGAGDIVFNKELPDGRFLIVLRGLCRVRLSELETETAWREARASVLPDTWPADHAGIDGGTQTMISLIRAAGARHQALASLAAEIDAANAPPDVLTHAVATRITEGADRQRVLETSDVAARVDLVNDLLAGLLAGMTGPSTLH
jgi:uncharacterized protein